MSKEGVRTNLNSAKSPDLRPYPTELFGQSRGEQHTTARKEAERNMKGLE